MRRVRECSDELFERELSHRVIGAFYGVYNVLGFGFLESVYRRALAIELTRRGFHVATEVPAEVRYDGELVGVFRADILVESRVVLELKAARKLSQADEMQVLNYLRATDLDLGFLLHFGPKPAFRRFIATQRDRAERNDSRSSASSASFASAGVRRDAARKSPLDPRPRTGTVLASFAAPRGSEAPCRSPAVPPFPASTSLTP